MIIIIFFFFLNTEMVMVNGKFKQQVEEEVSHHMMQPND